MIQILQELKN